MKRWLIPICVAAVAAMLSFHFLENHAAHAAPLPLAGKPHVAQWFDNKPAALSFTFDDGLQCHADIAAPMLHHFGIHATFFVVPGLARQHPSDPKIVVPRLKFGEGALSWDEIRTIHSLGMEIGNHSLTHAFLNHITDPKILDLNINHAADLITQNIGQRPLAFAFPYNEWSPQAMQMVLQHHIAVRDHWTDYGGPKFTAAFADNLVTTAIHNHAWLVPMIHGINTGFLPLSSQVLHDHLAFVKAHENEIWVDTFSTIARYQIERKNAALKVRDSIPGELTLALSNPPMNAPPVPLTVVFPLPQNHETDDLDAHNDTSGAPVAVQRNSNQILLSLLPGNAVTITWH